MSSIACLKHLRSAIFKEQAALVAMDPVYCDFIIKLLCYQTGKVLSRPKMNLLTGKILLHRAWSFRAFMS